MDDSTARAILAHMELTSQLLMELIERGAIDASWAIERAKIAASRLEPGSDRYEALLQNQWNDMARILLQNYGS